MKTIGTTLQTRVGAGVVLLACALLIATVASCAPAASPTPVPPAPTSAAPKATPAPAASAPTAAPAAPATPVAKAAPAPAAKGPSPELTQLIEAAKKEGKASIKLHSGVEAQPIREGIKRKFGIDLEIDASPSDSYPAAVAKAIAEYKAGTQPSYDLLPLSDSTAAQSINAAIVEKVNWAPLLIEGTPREVIQFDGYAISPYTGHIGMVYNPKVIPAAEAPKSFGDLTDPKWRGKIAAYNYATNYVNIAFVRGTDKTLADLRAFMKNNPVLEVYARGQTRFMANEYPILLTGSAIYGDVKQKGLPVEWVSPDFSWFSIHTMHVMKGSKQPNAAKLIALFLASPDGHKIYNGSGRGSMFYPGNIEFDIHQQDAKLGLKQFNPQTWPGAMEFLLSDKGKQLEDEVGRILRGG
ncbi:MAG: extracellular solute-binding protein [Chloroflexi bacterium]|nr:extracellular solute-binding protein [Chloroflexota bacterium]